MDAVLKSVQQQQVEAENTAGTHDHVGVGLGIGIRASSTADQDGSPFLSEISSSTRVNGHDKGVHARHGHAPTGLPDAHHGPGNEVQRDCDSPPLGDHDRSHGGDEGVSVRTSDMDGSSNLKAYVVGEDGGLGKVKVNGINELHGHHDDEYGPPSLDRSPSPLEHHHIINEDGEHMLHPGEWSLRAPGVPSLNRFQLFHPLSGALNPGNTLVHLSFLSHGLSNGVSFLISQESLATPPP